MISAAHSEYGASLWAWTLRSWVVFVGHRRSSAKAAMLKMLSSRAGTHGPLHGSIEGVVPYRARRGRE
eukprot:1142376-Pelagomonas_calceolata.AAC.1